MSDTASDDQLNAPVDEQAGAITPVQPTPAEERAQRLGWSPLDQWRGDPTKWRDADTFLRVNDESAPVMRERMRHMEEELSRVSHITKTAIDRARTETEARIRAELTAATEQGDVRRVQQLTDGLIDVRTVQQAPTEPPEVRSFRERNSWFGTDASLTQEAQQLSATVRQFNPAMSVKDEIDAVEREMNRRHTELRGLSANGATPRPGASNVEGGGVRLAPAKTSQVDKLPATARQLGQEMVEQGLYKNLEEYAAEYNSDVAVIRPAKRKA